MLNLALLILFSYLLGSIPFGFLMGKFAKGVDIREHGSRTIGATNTMRVLGKGFGVTALLLDVMKGVVPVRLFVGLLGTSVVSPEIAAIIAGFSAVVGHNWTVFLRFRGGKGVATSAGVFLGIHPAAVGVTFLVFLVGLAITKMVSVGSMVGGLALPVTLYLFGAPPTYIAFGAVAAVFAIWRHRENIRRILQGKENKIGSKKKET
ncbi:glycerol-3-phosphate 1-O-acyltransferase PlsY [Candidatus Hydrogenedentota bacterium]